MRRYGTAAYITLALVLTGILLGLHCTSCKPHAHGQGGCQSPCVALLWTTPSPASPGRAADVVVRGEDMESRTPSGAAAGGTLQLSKPMRPYHLEHDTAYHHNDLYMGMVTRDTPAACAAACTAWDSSSSSSPCMAWTWIPSKTSAHQLHPGECHLKSARGNDVQRETGLVSGYLAGTVPYQVESGVAYLGYDLVTLTHPVSDVQSPEECATACSRHQGRIRCKAWTFHEASRQSTGSSCSLKMLQGPNTTHDATATSGYVKGAQGFVLQQGVAHPASDLPNGTTQQQSLKDCGQACTDYRGPTQCVAWAFSSPLNSTLGTCWLKAAPDGAKHGGARSVVSGVLPGIATYYLVYNTSNAGDVLDVRPEPSPDACATACSTWQEQGSACAGWTWSPKKAGNHNRWCTLVSMVRGQLNATIGSVAGMLGTGHYAIEQGVEYATEDLATSTEESAERCAWKCTAHQGKEPECAAWTWHFPTAGHKAGFCVLKERRSYSKMDLLPNPQTVSGHRSWINKELWGQVVTSMIKPPAHKQVWGKDDGTSCLALAIVEVRQHPWLEGVLYNAAHMYGGQHNVTLHIFHGLDNLEVVQFITSGWQGVNLHNLGVHNVTWLEYQLVLTRPTFYENFKRSSHVLIFQADSLFLRPMDPVFLSDAFDYVGAPWPSLRPDTEHNGGNGGLSLRRVSAMLNLTRHYGPTPNTTAEDVYITARLPPSRLPTVSWAKLFSVELVYYPSPCGMHAAFGYQSEMRLRGLLQALAAYVTDPVLLR